MTFLQLCQEVRRECGIQGASTTPTTVVSQTGLMERVVDWTADADEYIQSKFQDWKFLNAEYTQDTVLGDDALAAPADLGMWDEGDHSFSVDAGTATGYSIKTKPYKEWRKNKNLKTNAPVTSITVKLDNSLVLAFPADGVYEIGADYWKKPVRMTVDASTTLIPVQYERTIVCRAKMYFFEDQEFIDLYKSAEKEFNEWMDKLEAHEAPGQEFRGKAETVPMAAAAV